MMIRDSRTVRSRNDRSLTTSVVASCAATAAAALALLACGGWLEDAAFAGGATKRQADDRPSGMGERSDSPERTDAADRVREGTRWQGERGTFTLVGDRVTFTDQRGQNFVALENLNLERIVRTIEENRTVTDADTLEWNVDAAVTEYRGANFILVTRSVLVARPRGSDTVR